MKTERIDEKILCTLSRDSFISASSISERIRTSEKTVRQHIAMMNDSLKDYEITIIAKHGKGYRLEIKNDDSYYKAIKDGKLPSNVMPQSPQERVEYIISYLLINEEVSDYLNFCEILNVSESTLMSDFRNVKKILNSYSIDTVIDDKNVMRLSGDEFSIRVCITNHFCNSNLLTEHSLNRMDEEKEIVYRVISTSFTKYNATMPEISLERFINHLYVTCRRIKIGHTITNQINTDRMYWDKHDKTIEMMKLICDGLYEAFNVEINEYEFDYLILYIIGQRINFTHPMQVDNIVVSSEIMDLVEEIIDFVYSSLCIDYREDFSLRMGLALHLLPLMIRLRYNIKIENPLLFEIKKNYPLSFTVAKQTTIFIETQFGNVISEDEIGYLALIFENSSSQKTSIKKRQNILITSALGRGSADLIAKQYRQVFSNYLDNVYVCNFHELDSFCFDNIDYVFSTAPIRSSIPVPIIEIKQFLDNEDIINLQRQLEKKEKAWISNFIKPELFIDNLKMNNKMEILDYLCDRVSEELNLKDDFKANVLKREIVGSTDFGETIALPHPFERVSEKTFACVCILDEPVFWGKHEISIIILLSIEKEAEGNKDLEIFYQIISEFLLSNIKAKKLLKNPIYDNLITLLSE